MSEDITKDPAKHRSWILKIYGSELKAKQRFESDDLRKHIAILAKTSGLAINAVRQRLRYDAGRM